MNAAVIVFPGSNCDRDVKVALAAGMRIDAALVDTVPLGVDTPADLARARSILLDRAPNAETST